MIAINFASRNYGLAERIRAGVILTIILLAAAAAVMTWSALSLSSETRGLEKKAGEFEKTESEFKPLLAERDRILKDFTAMSGLIESRRFSWTELLTDVEKIFPLGVSLKKIDYGRDGALTLDGTAQSPESLRNLMVGLERSPRFRDPYLKHQSVDKGSISFNVVVYYKGNNASGVGQGQ